MDFPKTIVLISGKRKSGKDYLSEKLLKTVGNEQCCIIRISAPIKSHYAKEKKLDLKELMSDNPYKEQYRLEMINWSDDVRKKDPGYFCKAACSNAPLKATWLVSDVRRKTDINWFKTTYGDKIKTVRISADEDVRKERGFSFTKGVDDVSSERDLDDFTDWNLRITNNNSEESENAIKQMLILINE